MQLEQHNATIQREARTSVLAAMETGNTARARTILRELAEGHPEYAKVLRLDVIDAYGIAI